MSHEIFLCSQFQMMGEGEGCKSRGLGHHPLSFGVEILTPEGQEICFLVAAPDSLARAWRT